VEKLTKNLILIRFLACMAFLDILRGRKREEGKPERSDRGRSVLKRAERPAKKREKIAPPATPERSDGGRGAPKKIKKETLKDEVKIKTTQSLLAAELLLKPHITEQSNFSAQKNIYTFRVRPSANKISIKKAIKEMYGFEPVKIRITNMPAKKRKVGGKTGIKSGFKKALVYLKEGEKIEFI